MGALLGSLTACSLAGYWQNYGSGIADEVASSGWGTTLPYVLQWQLIGGQRHSVVGAVKYTPQGIANVQTRLIVQDVAPGVCPWATASCSRMLDASNMGRLSISVDDTNGDGYISGNTSIECGLTSGTASYGVRMPLSATFQDTPACKRRQNGWNKAGTEASTDSPWGGTAIKNAPGTAQSIGTNIPFETLQAILNSMDSSDVTTEVVGGVNMQVAKMQVTNLKIGGDSYRPVNAFLNLYNWRAMGPMDSPGFKLMAAWAANKIEALLDRGATSIRIELELNGGVTLTRDSLPSSVVVTQPSYQTVEAWRKFATSGLRD